eukprot:5347693-Ditylum_brightwellii.AAC.1
MNASQKYQKNKVQLVGATLKGKGSARQNANWMKQVTATRDNLLNTIIRMAIDISIESTLGLAGISLMSATSPLPVAKAAHSMNTRKDPTRVRRHTFAAIKPSQLSSHITRVRPCT